MSPWPNTWVDNSTHETAVSHSASHGKRRLKFNSLSVGVTRFMRMSATVQRILALVFILANTASLNGLRQFFYRCGVLTQRISEFAQELMKSQLSLRDVGQQPDVRVFMARESKRQRALLLNKIAFH